MQAASRRFSGTRASSSALNVVFTHQHGCAEFPPCADAHSFGWPHKGQIIATGSAAGFPGFIATASAFRDYSAGRNTSSSQSHMYAVPMLRLSIWQW